ncbi:MAG: DUF2207 domain-containing protein [Alphaproteobacteria bacterium]|nr:DUF2207 domain-containing protein [Alphaproteobacteria bacterium]
MKKLFLAVYFIVASFAATNVHAGLNSFADPEQAQAYTKIQSENKKQALKSVKKPDYKDIFEVFEKRGDKVLISDFSEDELNANMAHSVVQSIEAVNAAKENNKSFLEKVYENAIKRATAPNPDYTQNILDNKQVQQVEEQQKAWETPNYATVNVTLPGGTKILAPAIEHIALLLADIDVLANSTVKVSETVVVVANGEKLKNGLSKALPRFSTARDGTQNKIDVNLSSVKINGQEFAYKTEEIGSTIIFSPKQQYELQPGVYTYEFEYIINRQLWTYPDFNEFYWNVTGDFWNLIIARAGATVRIPGTEEALSKTSFIVNQGVAHFNDVRTFNLNPTLIGVASISPVFVGESLQLLISIPKESFLPLNDKKTYWFINDYGDIILSLLGLIAIVGGYFISWIFISENKGKKNTITKTGPVMRYLWKNIFDNISFGSALLEFYKKNIIDIKQEEDKFYLIKISDNVTGLSRLEKNALKNLFIGSESTIEINQKNFLKLKRAFVNLKLDTESKVNRFLLKINSGYVAFSISMLLLAELGISLLSYNPFEDFCALLIINSVLALCIATILHKTKSFLQYLYKPFALLIIAISLIFLGTIVSTPSVIFITLIICAIFVFTHLFSTKNGLIKNTLREINPTIDNLKRNASTIAGNRSFVLYQPQIFALECSEFYEEWTRNKENNKLEIMQKIITKL